MTLTRSDLWSLEEYAGRRQEFRTQVIAHKKRRNIALGPHATLYFEDELTMRYQIQEMLRIERIFEAAEIEEELASYNPLIPNGSNWKATAIEYGDIEEAKPLWRPWAALNKRFGFESVMQARKSSPSPTKTWIALGMRKQRPYILCGSSSAMMTSPNSKQVNAYLWVLTMPHCTAVTKFLKTNEQPWSLTSPKASYRSAMHSRRVLAT